VTHQSETDEDMQSNVQENASREGKPREPLNLRRVVIPPKGGHDQGASAATTEPTSFADFMARDATRDASNQAVNNSKTLNPGGEGRISGNYFVPPMCIGGALKKMQLKCNSNAHSMHPQCAFKCALKKCKVAFVVAFFFNAH
jgi:hypothetical protein